jgi:hypothetical protein
MQVISAARLDSPVLIVCDCSSIAQDLTMIELLASHTSLSAVLAMYSALHCNPC